MSEIVRLKDGREVQLRYGKTGDGQLTYDFMLALGKSTDRMLTHPRCMRTPEQYEANAAKIADGEFYSLCAIDPDSGAIVGNAAFFFGARVKIAHVAGLAMGVLPEWQGLGLGSLLLNRAVEDMRKNPRILRLDLIVIDGNEHAKAMYERAGFVVEGHRDGAVRQPDGSFEGETMMGMW
ncbi:MAG: GNAT family N-acetyltransferase, partial [Phycisphaerales bacterium]